jgi:hypothetical protein
MTEEELDLLPYSFSKKYGTFIISFRDHQDWVKTEESREF